MPPAAGPGFFQQHAALACPTQQQGLCTPTQYHLLNNTQQQTAQPRYENQYSSFVAPQVSCPQEYQPVENMKRNYPVPLVPPETRPLQIHRPPDHWYFTSAAAHPTRQRGQAGRTETVWNSRPLKAGQPSVISTSHGRHMPVSYEQESLQPGHHNPRPVAASSTAVHPTEPAYSGTPESYLTTTKRSGAP